MPFEQKEARLLNPVLERTNISYDLTAHSNAFRPALKMQTRTARYSPRTPGMNLNTKNCTLGAVQKIQVVTTT